MQYALNEQEELVKAVDLHHHMFKRQYRCPGCNKNVFLKKGQIRMPHFSHRTTDECQTFSEGETEEHLEGKRLLFDFLRMLHMDVEMEAYLPNLQQRPDLLIPSKKIAIEFQCSYLPIERMIERSNGYTQNGYRVIWILGKKYHFVKKITSFQKIFVQDIGIERPYYLQLDTKKKQLVCFMELNGDRTRSSIILNLSTHFQKEELVKKVETLKKQSIGLKSKPKDLQKAHTTLYQNRIRKTGSFSIALYEGGDSIQSFPIECYYSSIYGWVLHTDHYSFNYRIITWLENKSTGDIFRVSDMLEWIEQESQSHFIRFDIFPLLMYSYDQLLLIDYLIHLSKSGIVSVISPTEWIFIKKAKRYKSEEEKLSAIKDKSDKLGHIDYYLKRKGMV